MIKTMVMIYISMTKLCEEMNKKKEYFFLATLLKLGGT